MGESQIQNKPNMNLPEKNKASPQKKRLNYLSRTTNLKQNIYTEKPGQVHIEKPIQHSNIHL